MIRVLSALLVSGIMAGLFVPAPASGPGATGAGVRRINLPGRTGTAPYSDAVLVGDTLYLAGRLGVDPATGRPPADVEEEVRLILDGMKAALAEAQMTMDDLVYVQVFCADVALLETFNRVYRPYFTGGYPARMFVGSGPLLFGARFEVQGVAARQQAARLDRGD